MPWTSLIDEGEDDSLLASLIACGGSIGVCNSDCLAGVRLHGLLIMLVPIEVVAFDCHICVANELLQQSSAVEDPVELAKAMLHQISMWSQRREGRGGRSIAYL